MRMANVLNKVAHLGLAGIDVGALIDAGQKGALPVLRFLNGVAWAHGDESGQVLVFRPKPIGEP